MSGVLPNQLISQMIADSQIAAAKAVTTKRVPRRSPRLKKSPLCRIGFLFGFFLISIIFFF